MFDWAFVLLITNESTNISKLIVLIYWRVNTNWLQVIHEDFLKKQYRLYRPLPYTTPFNTNIVTFLLDRLNRKTENDYVYTWLIALCLVVFHELYIFRWRRTSRRGEFCIITCRQSRYCLVFRYIRMMRLCRFQLNYKMPFNALR